MADGREKLFLRIKCPKDGVDTVEHIGLGMNQVLLHGEIVLFLQKVRIVIIHNVGQTEALAFLLHVEEIGIGDFKTRIILLGGLVDREEGLVVIEPIGFVNGLQLLGIFAEIPTAEITVFNANGSIPWNFPGSFSAGP